MHPQIAGKFGEDRTRCGQVITYFRFSKWRLSAILDLVWRHSGFQGHCILTSRISQKLCVL